VAAGDADAIEDVRTKQARAGLIPVLGQIGEGHALDRVAPPEGVFDGCSSLLQSLSKDWESVLARREMLGSGPVGSA
jgi:hypothetical protein